MAGRRAFVASTKFRPLARDSVIQPANERALNSQHRDEVEPHTTLTLRLHWIKRAAKQLRQVHYIYNRIPTSRLLRTVKPRSPYFSQVNSSMSSEPHGDKFSTAEWPDLPEEAHANIADCNRKAGFESEPRQVEQTRHEQFEHTQVLINDIKLDGAESYFSEVSDPFVKPFPDRPEGTSVRWVYVS